MRLYIAIAALVLVMIAGCITIDYKAEQEFREDGTSTLVVDEYLGLNKEFLESYSGTSSMFSSSDPGSVASRLVLEYYTTRDYPETLCRLMSGVTCSGKDNGYLHVEAELAPGDFYEVENEFDWVNLKEITTYSIERVPLGRYYAYDGRDESDVERALTEGAIEYALGKLDDELTDDYYCEEYSYPDLACEIKSISAGKATVRIIGDSYSPVSVKWIGCTDESYGSFIFVSNNSEAEEMFESVTDVNKVLEDEELVTETVDCPPDAETIVIAYETRSALSSTPREELGIFEIKTKEDIKESIEEELEDLAEDSSTGFDTSSLQTTSFDMSVAFLNFDKSEVAGMTFNELGEAASTGAIYSMEIEIEYTATFPGKIVSAEIGRDDVDFSNNQIRLDLDDLEGIDDGELVVTTEKEVSPLGAFTWVIVGIVILAVLGGVVWAVRK